MVTRSFLPLSAAVAALALVWLAVITIFPVDFWHSNDEYAFLALAHAYNFDLRLHGAGWFQNAGLTDHPGIPLYVVSWLCLKVAELLATPPSAFWFLDHPETFYLVTRIAAGLIGLASV